MGTYGVQKYATLGFLVSLFHLSQRGCWYHRYDVIIQDKHVMSFWPCDTWDVGITCTKGSQLRYYRLEVIKRWVQYAWLHETKGTHIYIFSDNTQKVEQQSGPILNNCLGDFMIVGEFLLKRVCVLSRNSVALITAKSGHDLRRAAEFLGVK